MLPGFQSAKKYNISGFDLVYEHGDVRALVEVKYSEQENKNRRFDQINHGIDQLVKATKKYKEFFPPINGRIPVVLISNTK